MVEVKYLVFRCLPLSLERFSTHREKGLKNMMTMTFATLKS